MNQNSAHSTKNSVINKVNSRPSKKSNKSLSSVSTKKRGSKHEANKYSRAELDLSEDNDKVVIVTMIKQEIIQKALEIIYEKYLERQTVYFVSHCSYLAWKSLIQWNCQRKDKGGLRELENKEHLDVELKPSPKDSWAGNSIPIIQKYPKELPGKIENRSLTTHVSEHGLRTVEDYHKAAEELTHKSSELTLISSASPSTNKKRFSKQYRKSEDPVVSVLQGRGIELRKDSYELPAPVPLQEKYFPSSRVEVKYNIAPGTRGQVTRKAPKVKTIHLKRSNDFPETNGNGCV